MLIFPLLPMKQFLSLLLGSLFLLSACTVPTASQHGGGHTTKGLEAHALALQDQSNETEIAFRITEDNKTFMDFGISHTKEMHLIVVRDDLQHFAHLHPTRDESGTWRVTYAAPAGGKYWLYADFVESNQSAHTIRFKRTHTGDLGEYGILKSVETTQHVGNGGGYDITMDATTLGDGGVQFNYWIYDVMGADQKLETYLGELGHSVLISPSGEFVHVHPFKEYVGYDATNRTHPVFVTGPLEDPYYRVFTQFQIKGKIITVEYDWQR